jgi:anthranilate synthase component 2
MGLAHSRLPVHGVQFHPESIASEYGHLLLKNFLEIAQAWNSANARRGAAHARHPQGAGAAHSRTAL